MSDELARRIRDAPLPMSDVDDEMNEARAEESPLPDSVPAPKDEEMPDRTDAGRLESESDSLERFIEGLRGGARREDEREDLADLSGSSSIATALLRRCEKM